MKILLLSLILVSGFAHASNEEHCRKGAYLAVSNQTAMIERPSTYAQLMLENEKADYDYKIKAQVRQDYTYVYQNRGIPSHKFGEMFYQKCMYQFK